MFSNSEATKERTAAYVAALEQERVGYLARLNALAAGKHELLDKKALEARVEAVDAEIARVTKPEQKSKSKGKTSEDE